LTADLQHDGHASAVARPVPTILCGAVSGDGKPAGENLYPAKWDMPESAAALAWKDAANEGRYEL
jgi:hypothetical protein